VAIGHYKVPLFTVLLVGPTTLLLDEQYGLEGGILFPAYQRLNGTQQEERSRLVVSVSYSGISTGRS
jgi:hypothetical protein